jgi:hypothetical protein
MLKNMKCLQLKGRDKIITYKPENPSAAVLRRIPKLKRDSHHRYFESIFDFSVRKDIHSIVNFKYGLE